MSVAKGWFTVEVGVTLRGRVRREIESTAWRRGLDIETLESKGFLESAYRFTVRGDQGVVDQFIADVSRWIENAA